MYKEYGYEEYIHFIKVLNEDGTHTRKVIDYEDIKSLSLDKYGRLAPVLDSLDVSNYLLRFWSPLIGSEAVMTLLYLKLHSHNKDYTCVSITQLSLIMGKSINTVKKYLGILEKYGFIAMFRRLHSGIDNREVSPYTKLRLTIPMLTEEQVLSLPKSIQKEHNEYINEVNKLYNNALSPL